MGNQAALRSPLDNNRAITPSAADYGISAKDRESTRPEGDAATPALPLYQGAAAANAACEVVAQSPAGRRTEAADPRGAPSRQQPRVSRFLCRRLSWCEV